MKNKNKGLSAKMKLIWKKKTLGKALKKGLVPTEMVFAEQALIISFRGKFEFLSNFFRAPFIAFETKTQEVKYPTVEHAYQARKTDDLVWRNRIIKAWSPASAKKIGRSAPMIPDWDRKKVAIMRRYLYNKFWQNPQFALKLVNTGKAVLIEGNQWQDRFWGMVNDGTSMVGMNVLGALLMEVRAHEGTTKLVKFTAKHGAHGVSLKVRAGKPMIHICNKCKKICSLSGII